MKRKFYEQAIKLVGDVERVCYDIDEEEGLDIINTNGKKFYENLMERVTNSRVSKANCLEVGEIYEINEIIYICFDITKADSYGDDAQRYHHWLAPLWRKA